MNIYTKSIFKERHTLEERKKLYNTKQIIHPAKILIILEQFIDSISSFQLCAADPEQLMITFEADMKKILQKNTSKTKYISLFFFIDNILPQKDQTLGQLQQKMRDKDDGFLYMQVKSLETLGSLY
ncbi:unnamed protein product [Paramecium sonneborni]|uniref:Autophagy-related protein n=1 Tax=Paramecium sonneborni TaxID=65129 RepID=A0A8S1LMB4_9CILI|nr:unnamed protein product [Paramecium sonneborni]